MCDIEDQIKDQSTFLVSKDDSYEIMKKKIYSDINEEKLT